MSNRAHLSFLFFWGLSLASQAQTGENKAIVFDQFFQNYSLVNPASLVQDGKWKIGLANRRYPSPLEGINKSYVDLAINKQTEKKQKVHTFGLLVLNDNEGNVFSKSRGYVRYAYSLQINELWSISFGTAIGAINYTLKSTVANAGGSSTKLDYQLGIWLKHRQTAIGLSSFQIPNPRLRPLNQEFVLDRYWNLNAYNKLDIYDGYYLTSHGYVRLQPDINPQLTAASILTMFHHVDFGGSYWHQKGISLLAGIKEINLFGGNANFLVSYFYDTRKWSSPGSGVIELTLGYGFLNEKKKADEQPSEE